MDNFYIKIHKGARKAFYKRAILSDKDAQQKDKQKQKANGNEVLFKSMYFKISEVFDQKLEYKDFDTNFFQNLRYKQLLHSQAICDGLPFRVDLELCEEALRCRIAEYKQLYEGTFYKDTSWRMALGLGNASVFETSITLHHTYGIPYIPASTVKGLLRSWLITEYFAVNDNDKSPLINAEYKALGNENFCQIFGCPADRQKVEIENNLPVRKRSGDFKLKDAEPTSLGKEHIGNIVFFDAFPTKPPTVSVDIMNPHYPEYYNNEPGSPKFQPPADWQSPVPIFFLTVKDTGFQFLFGIRKGAKPFGNIEFSNSEKTHIGNVVTVLKDLLNEALTNHGIGAKTAVGYGRMTNL